jgi:membrane protein DedA with SNARE-associated domain/rhodanese-related sulfurtransferase
LPGIGYLKNNCGGMNETFQFLIRHGVAVLFVAVFIEQAGLPLPAAPWLLAAGALAAAGKMNWFFALWAAAAGSLLADLIWFYLGRYCGKQVLGLLCRINLEPDSGVHRTQNFFIRYRMRGLVVAKFVPGLGALVVPLAGSSGVTSRRFISYDGLSSLLYAGAYMLLGGIFSRQLEQVINALAGLGHGALSLLIVLAALYIFYKYIQRYRLLNELRMARISVDELFKRLEAGENLMILDLRSHLDFEHDPDLIRGAFHMTMDEVQSRDHEIPRDRDIILCCSCPNEASSARVALQLHRKGILRVRPLLGGIDAWRKRNYPMELRPALATNVVKIQL